jgi:hypothetical protein
MKSWVHIFHNLSDATGQCLIHCLVCYFCLSCLQLGVQKMSLRVTQLCSACQSVIPNETAERRQVVISYVWHSALEALRKSAKFHQLIWSGSLSIWLMGGRMHFLFPTGAAIFLDVAVFWVVALCRLVEVYRRFRGPHCLHYQGDDLSDNGGSKHFWKIGKLLPD